MRKLGNYVLFLIGANLFWLSSCNTDEIALDEKGLTSSYTNEVANGWVALELELVKNTPGFSPPVGSRAMAYSGIALYESIVGGMPGYQSLASQLTDMPVMPLPEAGVEYSWALSANSTMAIMLKNLFPTAPASLLDAIDSTEAYFFEKYSAGIDAETVEASQDFGIETANIILEWAKTDGGHAGYNRNFPASYVAPEGAGLWKPDFTLNALQPYWGNNRFLLAGNDEKEFNEPPTAYSEDINSQFYKEANEVYEAVNNLTAEQRTIANYWTDDAKVTYTPPGHALCILHRVLEDENKDLAFAAEAYAKFGIAVSDAFIYCWKQKFHYNLIRPDAYIQAHIDPFWQPLLITPPFPEHTSGHSVQSGAAAEVLTGLFGDNYSFTDYSHDHLDLGMSPHSFDSFYDFADEAAISRLYGGIHFRPAIELGLVQGKRIGARVNQLKFRK